MSKKKPSILAIYIRGLAMGISDVVPGVSGGTIALITGIYPQFVNSIKSFDLVALRMLLRLDFRSFMTYVNGRFLFSLVAGIATSVLAFSAIILYLLDHYAVYVWSFFFGLVMMSIVYLISEVKHWSVIGVINLVLMSVLSYYVTVSSPSDVFGDRYFLFFAGFVAIVAMVLPGISGSFILLLLGGYYLVFSQLNVLREGLSTFDIDKIVSGGGDMLLFGSGALLGLVIFSRVISWLFNVFPNLTYLALIGFMVGSLNKIWPWKETLSTRINSKGVEVPFLQKSILPTEYGIEFVGCVVLALIASVIIYLIHRKSQRI